MARGRFTERLQDRLAGASTVLMTLATLVSFANLYASSDALALASAFLAGVGITWGQGTWLRVFVLLSGPEILLYSMLVAVVFSVMAVMVAALPEYVDLLLCIALPMVSYLMYLRSVRTVESRGLGTSFHRAVPVAIDDAYGPEPRSTWVRAVCGVTAFSFVVGISRGFPSGHSLSVGIGGVVAHFALLSLAALLVIGVALVRGRRLRFAALWQVQLAALTLGLLLLASFNPTAERAGSVLIATTNHCQIFFLWLTALDIARHRPGWAFHALGAAWFFHQGGRELGRLLIAVAAPGASVVAVGIVAGLLCLLIVCMALLLTNEIPRTRPLFGDYLLEAPGAPTQEQARGRSAAEDAGPSAPESRDAVTALEGRFGLTPRESDVVALILEGRTATRIAEQLCLSPNTVRYYTKGAYGKLGVHSKQELLDLVGRVADESRR